MHADWCTGVWFVQKEDKTPLWVDEGVGRGWREKCLDARSKCCSLSATGTNTHQMKPRR